MKLVLRAILSFEIVMHSSCDGGSEGIKIKIYVHITLWLYQWGHPRSRWCREVLGRSKFGIVAFWKISPDIKKAMEMKSEVHKLRLLILFNYFESWSLSLIFINKKNHIEDLTEVISMLLCSVMQKMPF